MLFGTFPPTPCKSIKTDHTTGEFVYTFVETMGTFLSQALKASEGSKHWLEFFAVTGSAFASLEKCPPLAQYAHLSEMETCEMVRAMEYELGVIEKLRAYGSAVQASANSDKAAHYYLLVLKPFEKMVLITGFSKR